MGTRTILVVDDDPDIRRIAALSLERIGGYRVVLADSGAEGLARARESLPDLVLLDVSMPTADGPTTLAALRSDPATAHVPVVFFTATANQEEVDALRRLGVLGVVSKPFDVKSLPGRIRDLCVQAGLE